MLSYVILVLVAITATFHNTCINGKLENKFSSEENEMLNNNHWTGEKVESIEKQIKQFGAIIQVQSKKMENAENEIDKLKATVQRQDSEIKFLENKLDKYEFIVKEQMQRLYDNEKVMKELESTVTYQDIEIARMVDRMTQKKGNIQREDSKIKVQGKTDRNLYTSLLDRETRNEEKRNSDSAANILKAQEHKHSDFSNSTAENLKEMSPEQSSGNYVESSKSINPFIRDKKRSFQDIVSLHHKKKGQVSIGIAFSAYLGHIIYNMSIGYTVKCDQVLLNDGNAYSPYTGVFTVPETGVYLLTFSIAAAIVEDKTHVKLVSNNRNIVDAVVWTKVNWHHVMGGNTAIVRLNSGEKLWLEIYDTAGVQLYSRQDYRWVTFSGVLLYS